MNKNYAETFSSLYNIFAPKPFQNVYHLHTEKSKNKDRGLVYPGKFKNNEDNENISEEMPYVTSEKYHGLNKSSSDKSIVRSTSTLFYDLDKLVKRHSYHCITELTVMNNTIIDNNKRTRKKNAFGAKSETIVQECATKNQPNLRLQDSLQVNAKKVKKKQLHNPKLSSEICLNDEEDTKYNKDLIKHEDYHNQEFWSFAKYKTEYTEPMKKEKKCKKKDRGKRTEDPCPCQLFSYACPCTDKKSLTELAKNSKSKTVTDQVTSTAKFVTDAETNYKNSQSRKSKCNQDCDSKLIESNFTDLKETYKVVPLSDNQVTQVTHNRFALKVIDSSFVEKCASIKSKKGKKCKQIICPNCKQKLDVISITEEEDLKPIDSPIIRNSVRSSQQESIKNYNEENFDTCNHNPPCEQVPICQILPTNNNTNNTHFTHVENVSTLKHNPRMIRITKACRHHPPCTVVPSCQRINVLKNNCEYIPPCLHRPRCINLPLCVPLSKNFYCDDVNNRPDEVESIECCAQYKDNNDSLNSCVGHRFHATQNTCEYLNEYSPRFVFNPKMMPESNFASFLPKNISCKCCLSNKSCQYDCIDCQCAPRNNFTENTYDEAVVYVRDVGCQFRNKNFSPQESLQYSKSSTTSLCLDAIKVGNYYNQYHTLRYEDKCTNPISGEELSMSTFTSSSLEIDIHCPSHGKKSAKGYTEFNPISTSPVIAAFTNNPKIGYNLKSEISRESSKSDGFNTHPTKPRKSYLKGYHKKVFHDRKRRTTTSRQKYKSNSKKI